MARRKKSKDGEFPTINTSGEQIPDGAYSVHLFTDDTPNMGSLRIEHGDAFCALEQRGWLPDRTKGEARAYPVQAEGSWIVRFFPAVRSWTGVKSIGKRESCAVLLKPMGGAK